ncbi:Ppx/GppA phosphatase family protein [Crocosphaera sp. Alani8]|uniref:Ppx/GppA phosphatase family protein n=1 Tax=Crocosphaera sp. Alani8 TaxID=3038952 RepID=UPI00313D0C5B
MLTNNPPSHDTVSKETCTLAAIDIGTNSIHMVIVEVDKTLPAFTIISREKDTVRLGERDPKTGNLTKSAIARSLASLRRCKELAKSFGVEHIIAAATSATREAPNGLDFIWQVQEDIGITINLISGYEEARRIYLGVLSGLDFQEKPHVIIDIGGGSTEIILADAQEPRFLSSTKVGAVRLTNEFITSDPINETELTYLQAYVRGMLERPIDELRGKLQPGEIANAVGTSGTIETLVGIHAMQNLGELPSPLQGYEMSRQDLKDMVQQFISLTYEERINMSGMSEKRAEIIVAGAVILLEAMTMLGLESITICERALREGMIVDWMLNNGLIESRLSFQTEVRKRSVYKIARKYQVDLDYGKRVGGFAVSLFDQLWGTLHAWGKRERELLWSATVLHNCGVYISHSAHHKHSYYLIRHAELLGFTEMEIETIANIARYHRKSSPKKKHDAYSKLPDNYRKQIKHLSAILRIAVALDRRQIGAIKEFHCKYDEEYKKLHLHLIPSNDKDDCTLELWSLDCKKVVFEDLHGLKIVTTLESKIS